MVRIMHVCLVCSPQVITVTETERKSPTNLGIVVLKRALNPFPLLCMTR